MVSTFAIIIPAHAPRLMLLNQLVESLFRSGPPPAQVLIVASNSEERELFCRKFDSYELAVIDATMQAEAMSYDVAARITKSDGSIINIKKFIGLSVAFRERKSDFALVIDSDSLAISPSQHVFDAIVQNYRTRRIFGAPTSDEFLINILTQSLALNPPTFVERKLDVIRRRPKSESNVYPWYFDPPTYGRRDFLAFVKFASAMHGSFANFLTSLQWHTFDWLVFVDFLVRRRGWRYVDYSAITPALPEQLSVSSLMEIASVHGHRPTWAWHSAILEDPKSASKISTLGFAYHVDRGRA